MTEYYQFETDNYADYGVKKSPRLSSPLSFFSGRPLKEKDLPPLEFEVNFPTGCNLPHFLGDVIPVVSERLISAFQDTGIDNFQTFPALLKNPKTGDQWDGFHAFNVIGILKAAVLEKSDFDTLMDGDSEGVPMVAFNDITLDKSKILKYSLFRMAESPDIIIVSKKLVDALINNRPEGGWQIDVVEVDVI